MVTDGIRRPRLVIEDLTVGYNTQQPVIKHIDLKISDGAITVLVGPNGCGKSTLIKAIARVLKPLSGRVLLDGENIHQADSRNIAQKIALLPQAPIAPEGLTVRELVGQGRFPHQSLMRRWSKEDSAIVGQAMYDADVSRFADRAVSDLSGGQRQRVWIAMILAQQTDFLLLDEPTTYLDMKVQTEVLTLLSRITRDAGRTLILVLHELNMAAAFADDMIMMRSGRIITQGSPEEVFTAENLATVFHLNAAVIRDPNGGYPVCLPHLPKMRRPA